MSASNACILSNLTLGEFVTIYNIIKKDMPTVRVEELPQPAAPVQVAPVQAPPVQAPFQAPVIQSQVQYVQNFNSHQAPPQSSTRKNKRVQYPCPNGCTNENGEPKHGSKYHRDQVNVKYCAACALPGMKSFQQWKDYDLQEEKRSISSTRSEEKEEEKTEVQDGSRGTFLW